MIETFNLLISETFRAIGRVGFTLSIGANPEHCPQCGALGDHDDLNDETIDAGGADGRG